MKKLLSFLMIIGMSGALTASNPSNTARLFQLSDIGPAMTIGVMYVATLCRESDNISSRTYRDIMAGCVVSASAFHGVNQYYAGNDQNGHACMFLTAELAAGFMFIRAIHNNAREVKAREQDAATMQPRLQQADNVTSVHKIK